MLKHIEAMLRRVPADHRRAERPRRAQARRTR